jgi:hypothetical protein
MDEETLRRSLRRLAAPDEAAAERRARELVLAAHGGRAPARRLRRRGVAAVVASLLGTGVAVTAVQGAPIARWVGHALDRVAGGDPIRPAGLGELPGGGRLLVATGRQAWIVGQGADRPVAHTGGQVSWSAFGHYIACACGTTLEAVLPTGRVVWSERFGAAVSAPTWSPDGNRIAFAVGGRLHVTAADGTESHRLAGRVLRGPAAWRPGPAHELAVADAPGRVSLVAADSGRVVARMASGGPTVSLGWSRDGARLLAATAGAVRVFDGAGRLVALVHPPAGSRVRAAALSPSGRQVAALLGRPGGGQEALLAPAAGGRRAQVLLAGEDLGDLFFSPDGRWLLVGWHRLDSWLFFTTTPGRAQVRQLTHVAARVGAGEPAVAGWCCGTSG